MVELCDILIEFLEVATHTILYFRKLYPETVFELRRKYDTPIHVSIHPQVNAYIDQCLLAAQFLIKLNELRKFVICIFNDDGVQVQRFVFDIVRLSTLTNNENDPYFVTQELSLRAFCLRMASSNGFLKPISSNCTFTIQLHTDECSSIKLAQNPELQNFPWLELDKNYKIIEFAKITPLKTIENDNFILDIFVEESPIL